MPRRRTQLGDRCPKGHEIIGENVTRIGQTLRCRTCVNEYKREYQRRLSTPKELVFEIGAKCFKGHVIDGDNVLWKADGRPFCRRCRAEYCEKYGIHDERLVDGR